MTNPSGFDQDMIVIYNLKWEKKINQVN
jgi:hypothetical protein